MASVPIYQWNFMSCDGAAMKPLLMSFTAE